MTTIPVIDVSARSVTYLPVASAGPFVVDWPMFTADGEGLAVYLDGTAVAGWTYAGEQVDGFYGAPSTWVNGSVTLGSAVTGTLVIASTMPVEREGQFAEGRGTPARDLNHDFNKAAAFVQETRRDIGRALLVPMGEVGSALPPADDRAGMLLGFDADGKAAAIPPSAVPGGGGPIVSTQIIDSTVSGRALLTASSVLEQQALLSVDAVTLERFGGGAAVADNAAALNAAVSFAVANNRTEISIGAAVYGFMTKPAAIPPKIKVSGVNMSVSAFVRNYSEAGGDEVPFIEFLETGTTPGTSGNDGLGGGVSGLTLKAGAGTTGGTMIKGRTAGAVTGYYTLHEVNITYHTAAPAGSFKYGLILDGAANNAVGAQGIRDMRLQCEIFVPAAGKAALLRNCIAARGTVAVFGAGDRTVELTGGATNETQSQLNVIDLLGQAHAKVDYGHSNALGGRFQNITYTANANALGFGPNVANPADNATISDASPIGQNIVFSARTTQTTASGQFGGKRNLLANVVFAVDQRNSGAAVNLAASPTLAYPVDRWHARTSATASGTLTAQRVTDAAGEYAIRLLRSVGTYAGSLVCGQTLEESRIHGLKAGGSVTLSVSVRCGPAFAGAPAIGIITSTTAGQTSATVASGWATATSQSQALSALAPGAVSTTSKRYDVTFSVPSGTKSLFWFFDTGNLTGTAGANDWCEFKNPQIESGPFASPFERPDPISDELECRRYLYRFTPGSVAQVGVGYMTSTTNLRATIEAAAVLRTGGTLTVTAANTRTYVANAQATPSAVTLVGVNGTQIVVDATISATTQFAGGILAMTSGATIQYEAEI